MIVYIHSCSLHWPAMSNGICLQLIQYITARQSIFHNIHLSIWRFRSNFLLCYRVATMIVLWFVHQWRHSVDLRVFLQMNKTLCVLARIAPSKSHLIVNNWYHRYLFPLMLHQNRKKIYRNIRMTENRRLIVFLVSRVPVVFFFRSSKGSAYAFHPSIRWKPFFHFTKCRWNHISVQHSDWHKMISVN